MEITNEIKVKVFAQYLGQYVQCDSEHHGKKELNDRSLFGLPPCKLILKPISEINDEDAIEVAVLAGMTRPMNRFQFVISRHTNYAKHILSEYIEGYRPVEDKITGSVWLSIFQHLKQRGYDLPQYLLGGKTLKECDLAIYEN